MNGLNTMNADKDRWLIRLPNGIEALVSSTSSGGSYTADFDAASIKDLENETESCLVYRPSRLSAMEGNTELVVRKLLVKNVIHFECRSDKSLVFATIPEWKEPSGLDLDEYLEVDDD